MKKIAIVFVLLLVAASCKKKESAYDNISSDNETEAHIGKSLMETQCFLCHSPLDAENERVAPPMIAIKVHYIDDGTSKEEFTNAMLNFLEKPSAEKAKLKGAVRKFGVMPYQHFSEEDIKQIAEYIYDYEIEEPEWFEEHFKNRGNKKGEGKRGKGKKGKGYKNQGKTHSANQSNAIKDIGLSYALGTKKVLGKNLMGTIQKEGTLEALKFCNVKAYPLTDSMANHYNAQIKRVSDKPRNPSNQANPKELKKIEYFKDLVAGNEEINPVVEKYRGEKYFYYPILTNSMCLQCHGKPSTIEPDVLTTLNKLYPEDLALGYDVNQVRGIWSITFKNK